jgi:integrase/recombinase XerD
MLTIYRRHLVSCEHRAEGREYRRCHCPVWVDGFIGGVELRESLKTRNWQKANDTIQSWEARGSREEQKRVDPLTVIQACDAYEADAKARGLAEATLEKYELLFRRLREFADERGLRFAAELNLEVLRDFRNGWKQQNLTALKTLERLRAFLRFAHESGWIPDNIGLKIKNPKTRQSPTLPLSKETVVAILAACHNYPDRANAVRLFALVLLLRYSGLRIRDAVTLRRDRVQKGKLFLYTAKTGTPVWCPLPTAVMDALAAIPLASSAEYFFWSGESKPKSCVGDWQRSLRTLFDLAGVPDAHAHRFRDTFAVELLLAGVPLERVSMLLGHQSVRITERHYSPWVAARQEQLEGDVRRTWGTDLVALAKMRGTPQVHGAKLNSNLLQIQPKRMVEAAGVEPASENVTGQETTCLFRFMPWALPQDVRDSCSERTRNSWR